MQNEKSVVYGHYDKNGTCFYIGSSYLHYNRPYNKQGKNYLWHKHAKNGYTVKILHIVDDRKTAFEIERKEIQNTPTCINIFGRGFVDMDTIIDIKTFEPEKVKKKKPSKPKIKKWLLKLYLKMKDYIITNGIDVHSIYHHIFTEEELKMYLKNKIKYEKRNKKSRKASNKA